MEYPSLKIGACCQNFWLGCYFAGLHRPYEASSKGRNFTKNGDVMAQGHNVKVRIVYVPIRITVE
jgi:hypothetical protein